MSSKNQVHETDEHLEQRRFLIKLEEAIEALDEHKLNAERVKELNVNLCHMSLDQYSELKPRFFARKPNLPGPSDEILDEASPIILLIQTHTCLHTIFTLIGTLTHSTKYISMYTRVAIINSALRSGFDAT